VAPERPDLAGAERPDPALGVFETLLVRDGRVQALAAHLRRLSQSVSELYGATLPAGLADQLRRRVADLDGEHRLRLDAVPSATGVEIDWLTSPLQPRAHHPVALGPTVLPGGLGPHKWADRRWLDRFAAGEPIALILDRDGSVLEAAWASVWVLEAGPGPGRLLTPPADGRLLAGITRGRLLELAPELDLEAAEQPLSVGRLRAADAVFLSSSLRHAVPARLADQPPGGAGHPAVQRIREALREGDF